MKQTSLENIEWDDENPINKTQTVDTWIKLENIGDILTGVFTDVTKDSIYNRPIFFFNNATYFNNKTGEKTHYDRIGLNNSGNMSFWLTEENLGPIKIIRKNDLPPKEKGMNPTHQFNFILPKEKTP